MPRNSWNACGLLLAAAFACAGCAKPADTPASTPAAPSEEQTHSTTGGGAEVPMTDAPEAADAPAAAETPSTDE